MFKKIITTFLLFIITFPAMAAQPGGDGGIITPPTEPTPDPTQICAPTNCGDGYYCDTSIDIVGTCEKCGQSGAFDYVTQCQFNPPYENVKYTSTNAKKSSCTWHAECPAGSYLYKTISYTGKNGCGNGSQACYRPVTSCKMCSELGAPYYNNPERINIYSAPHENKDRKSCPQHLSSDNPTTDDLLDNYIKPLLKCTDNLGTEYECPDSDNDIDKECSKCTDNTIVNSDQDGCISCTDVASGTTANNNKAKCICSDGYYYYNTSSESITQTENNNQECKIIPYIIFKWTTDFKNDKQNYHTLGRFTYQEGSFSDYSFTSSDIDNVMKQIKNDSIFPLPDNNATIWNATPCTDQECDAKYMVNTITYDSSRLSWTIKAATMENQMKSAFTKTLPTITKQNGEKTTVGIIITPNYESKTIEYYYVLDGKSTPPQKCVSNISYECTAKDTTNCYAKGGIICNAAKDADQNAKDYIIPEDPQWILYEDDQPTNTTYNKGDLILTSSKTIKLVAKLTKCPTDSYCPPNQKPQKCPNGLKGGPGATSQNDCKTVENKHQICDNNNNCIYLPTGLKLIETQQ